MFFFFSLKVDSSFFFLDSTKRVKFNRMVFFCFQRFKKRGFSDPGCLFFPRGKLIHLCFVFWHIHGGKICFIFLLPKSVKHMYKVIQNSVLLFFVLFSSVIVALFCLFMFVSYRRSPTEGLFWDVFVVVLGFFFFAHATMILFVYLYDLFYCFRQPS